MTSIAAFRLRAVGQWKKKSGSAPEGFIIVCNNPKIVTGRFKSWEKAFEQFQEQMQSFVKKLIPSDSPEIEYDGPVFRGKTTECSGDSTGFTLECEPEEISITWLIYITPNQNHTLDEFADPLSADNVFPELKKQCEEEGITVTLHSAPAATAGGRE